MKASERTKNENLRLFFVWLVRKRLHRNNICSMNHDIDVEVVSPSKGKVRVTMDGKRSSYLEGEVLSEMDRYGSIPVMKVYPGPTSMSSPIIVPEEPEQNGDEGIFGLTFTQDEEEV